MDLQNRTCDICVADRKWIKDIADQIRAIKHFEEQQIKILKVIEEGDTQKIGYESKESFSVTPEIANKMQHAALDEYQSKKLKALTKLKIISKPPTNN